MCDVDLSSVLRITQTAHKSNRRQTEREVIKMNVTEAKRVIDNRSRSNRVTVDTPGACEMFSCGRATAEKIAEAAGAIVYVGRRKFFLVDKMQRYLEAQAAGK